MKRVHLKIIGVALLAVLITAVTCSFLFNRPTYRPLFAVSGDVHNALRIWSADSLDTYAVKRNNNSYRGVRLQDLIARAEPFSSDFTVVIRGEDGLLAQVDGGQTDGMTIVYTAENGWEMINEYHPPSSNIKRIAEIYVVSDIEVPDQSVRIISADETIAVFSPGQLFMSKTEFQPVFQGTSVKASGDRSYEVTVYTERRFRAVSDIASDANDVLVMGAEGQYKFDPSPGVIALSGNVIQYIFSNGKTTMDHVRGILINPPGASNMDAYHEAVNSLDLGNRVMVFLMDGFGYHQYLYATQNGYAPGLASLKPAVRAASEYRPVTNTGLAAMLTGRPPFENGISNRGMTDLKAPDLFDYASQAGKTSAYIEGNVKIVNTAQEPRLNADRNKNDTDDEVFESAREAVLSGADLVFVHFHGVDAAGHTYGDLHGSTMEKVREVDSYISQLTEDFHGTVIITSDHGMHADGGGGSHGVFCPEDMIIPYLSFYRGK